MSGTETDELTEARRRSATYTGLLARWVHMTGRKPAPDGADRFEHYRNEFRAYLRELEEGR